MAFKLKLELTRKGTKPYISHNLFRNKKIAEKYKGIVSGILTSTEKQFPKRYKREYGKVKVSVVKV